MEGGNGERGMGFPGLTVSYLAASVAKHGEGGTHGEADTGLFSSTEKCLVSLPPPFLTLSSLPFPKERMCVHPRTHPPPENLGTRSAHCSTFSTHTASPGFRRLERLGRRNQAHRSCQSHLVPHHVMALDASRSRAAPHPRRCEDSKEESQISL